MYSHPIVVLTVCSVLMHCSPVARLLLTDTRMAKCAQHLPDILF